MRQYGKIVHFRSGLHISVLNTQKHTTSSLHLCYVHNLDDKLHQIDAFRIHSLTLTILLDFVPKMLLLFQHQYPALEFHSPVYSLEFYLFIFFSLCSAYYSDICVGAIACRLEKKEGGAVRVYIMTLGVLAPYRGLGIGEFSASFLQVLCLLDKELFLSYHSSK